MPSRLSLLLTKTVPGTFAILALTPVLAGPARAQSDALGPTIGWERNLVLVSGVTAGGEVAWLGITREAENYLPITEIHREVAIAGADGAVALELDRDVPSQSIWVAVDLVTGQFAAETPGQVVEIGTPTDNIGIGSAGLFDRLVHHLARAQLFLARPGVGAWTLTAGNGGPGDEDGRNDADLTVDLSALEPLGIEPPPSELAVGDVLVMVDLESLDFYAVRLQ